MIVPGITEPGDQPKAKCFHEEIGDVEISKNFSSLWQRRRILLQTILSRSQNIHPHVFVPVDYSRVREKGFPVLGAQLFFQLRQTLVAASQTEIVQVVTQSWTTMNFQKWNFRHCPIDGRKKTLAESRKWARFFFSSSSDERCGWILIFLIIIQQIIRANILFVESISTDKNVSQCKHFPRVKSDERRWGRKNTWRTGSPTAWSCNTSAIQGPRSL